MVVVTVVVGMLPKLDTGRDCGCGRLSESE